MYIRYYDSRTFISYLAGILILVTITIFFISSKSFDYNIFDNKIKQNKELAVNNNSNNIADVMGGNREKYIVYTIKPGDTLWKISLKFGIDVDILVVKNKISNPDLIHPGDKLIIPQYD